MPGTIGFIGCGNMGYAIVHGAITHRVIDPSAISIVEKNAERREWAQSQGCTALADVADLQPVDQLVLAVKPQSFPEVAGELGRLDRPCIVTSVMAGIRSSSIREALGEHARVIRTMPNTPAMIGHGVAGVAMGDGSREGDELLARELLDSIGTTIMVDESMMDVVTAVSGSGPAYVYLLAEAWEKAAIELGLDQSDARHFVQQTIRGAAAMMLENDIEPSELRAAVTSKGGTTAAALDVMIQRDIPGIVKDAVEAAAERGRELAGDS